MKCVLPLRPALASLGVRLAVMVLVGALMLGAGVQAEAEAEARVSSLARKGDEEGAAVWRRIGAAVKRLRESEAPAGTKVH